MLPGPGDSFRTGARAKLRVAIGHVVLHSACANGGTLRDLLTRVAERQPPEHFTFALGEQAGGDGGTQSASIDAEAG